MHWILPVGVFNPNKPGVPETAGPIRISEAIVTSSVALMCFIGRITLAKDDFVLDVVVGLPRPWPGDGCSVR